MDTQVSCPVCTLYLREGVSLQSHLNTHPKEQVIEALVKYYSAVKEGTNTNSAQSTSEQQQFVGQQNEQSVIESGSSSLPSQQYPCGSSHFTAAVTYQQFMSSNASVGGTVLPQCFSVPAIIATPTGETSQTALMPLLYNPYVIQQQQQQLQFYNSFRTLPQQPITRQVLSPSQLFPVSQQFNITAVDNPVSQSNVTVSSSSTALQNVQNIQNGSTLFLPSTTSNQVSNLKIEEKPQSNDTEVSGELKSQDEVDSEPVSKEDTPVQCGGQEISPETEEQSITSEADTDECEMVLPTVYEDETNNDSVVPLPDSNARNNPRANAECNSENQDKNICVNDRNIDNVETEDLGTDCGNGDNVLEMAKSTSPGLRVRNDLSLLSPTAPEDENMEDESEGCGGALPGESSEDILGIPFPGNGSDVEHSSEANNDCINNENMTNDATKDDQSTLLQDNCELIVSDLCPPEENDSANVKLGGPSVGSRDNNSNTTAEPTSGEFNVVDIDGIHILVPSHYLDNAEINQKFMVNRIPSHDSSTGSCSVINLGEEREAEGHPVLNQDIQTDEVMPPMGELSGQESIGENDTSSWSQEKDEVSTSYDLLARESWEASDGSDDESGIGESIKDPEPIAQQPVQSVEIKKEKLKCFYKCWTCNEVFTCPKERRVHQSEKHAKKSGFNPMKIENKDWHEPLENDTAKNEVIKHELQEVEEVHLKAEPGLLNAVSVEIEEHKPSDETNNSVQCAEDCLKEPKSLVEVPKDGETAFKFICSRCECVFASAKSLHRHARSTHGRNPFACRTCDAKFPTEAEYLAHLKIHPLECSRCGKYFYRHQNLNLHIRRHLGIKPFKCSICDKAFVTKQKLAEHTNTHTGNTPIKCNLCPETFRRYSNLIQHKNRHHLKLKKKVKDFICHCGEIFHSQKKLLWHKEIHDEKPKTCNYCSERFVHASSLTRHIRKAHDQRYFPCRGRENENVECPICGCIFLKSSLPVHMRLHSGERPFNCHICGKNFSTKWNLQLHRWTHASRSLKPYKCTLCKSAFIRHSEYTSHMHSHRNVRPYTCNYCGSQFIRKYNCIRHAREHEGEKPFSCTICQKAFHRRYYLKEHMRIHSGVRPFTCHICGKTSSTKSNHNKHVKIHHAREAVNTEG